MSEAITFNKYEANTLWLALNDCLIYHEQLAKEVPALATIIERQKEPMQELITRINEKFGFRK